MEVLAIDFYKKYIFTAQDDIRPYVVTCAIEIKVTEAMNERLCAPPTDAEIENALPMMHPSKPP